MERVQRMKTATSPKALLANFASTLAASGTKLKPFATLTAAAMVTLSIGLSVPLGAGAQDTATRTIATGSGIPLATNAPDTYTVKTGDTLWDISKVFLRDPWYWPEIWYVNPQIKNPHLIYPGDTLSLASLNGRPQVSVTERGPEGAAAAEAEATGPTRSGTGTRLSPKVRGEPITAAITAIPYSEVKAFLTQPAILTKEQVNSGPYIVGIRDGHLAGSIDHDIYARGLTEAENGTRYNIIHVDKPLLDPENNDVLGYRGIYVGSALITGPGDISKLHMDVAKREALRGDKLYPQDISVPLDFIPHPVAENMHGSIIAVEGVSMAGARNIAAINRGKKQGVELGHVLAISQRGETVSDKFEHGGQPSYWSTGKKVKLPDERVGVMLIFKVEELVSYGLIMEASYPVRVGDYVVTP
jgi:nucleoid-associated protein YgaU